jgi:hypothetical protein
MRSKSVALEELIMASPEAYPAISEIRPVMATVTAAFLPIGADGATTGYRPGLIEIFPTLKKARFISLRAYEFRKAHRKLLSFPLWVAVLGLTVALCIDVAYFVKCGGIVNMDIMHHGPWDCYSSISDHPLFGPALWIGLVALAVAVAMATVMRLDSQARNEARVGISDDLWAVLKREKQQLTLRALAREPKERAAGRGKKMGKLALGSASGLIGGALGGTIGEIISESVSEEALDREAKKKQDSWRRREAERIRQHLVGIIWRHHEAATGRLPLTVSEHEFLTVALFTDTRFLSRAGQTRIC